MELAVIAAIYSTVGWLGWIIIGGIAGALAGLVMRGGGFGLLGDIIVGIVGAIIGGFIVGLFVNTTVGVWGALVTAFIGACILIAILRIIAPGRTSSICSCRTLIASRLRPTSSATTRCRSPGRRRRADSSWPRQRLGSR